MTTVADTQVLQTLSILSQLEITLPSWDLYVSETSTWAAQKNRKPHAVVRPSSTQSLAKVLAHLATTDLDIAIRGSGFGSASAGDVLVYMVAFNDFEFDSENEIVAIGAGLLWRDHYEKMEQVAPEY